MRKIRLRSPCGSTIEEVKVKEGDRIKKGEIILERDQALLQTEVDRLSQSAELTGVCLNIEAW
ncbi:MAG: biotin/lipoyl-binding protein [Microcoleus sp. SIO2G3]|nr:biotin/lipoyl-binding protein [Microcoleus sp. SIO2G3]